MRNQFESLVTWSLMHPIVTMAVIACLQLFVLALVVELLSRFVVSRDVVLKHRLWRLVVVLGLVAIPLHLVAEYGGFYISIARTEHVVSGIESSEYSPAENLLKQLDNNDSGKGTDLMAQSQAYASDAAKLPDVAGTPSIVMVGSEPSVEAGFIRWTLIVYVLGVIYALSRIAYAYIALHISARKMPAVESSSNAEVEVLRQKVGCRETSVRISEKANSPYVLGIFWPVLVVPQGFSSWSGNERMAVLLHELAHVKRNDFLWSLLSQIMAGIYWPHPASWWINRSIVKTREQATDEHAITTFGSRPDYARSLIQVVERFSSQALINPQSSSLAISMSAFQDLTARVQGVLDGRLRASQSMRWLVRCICGVAIVCVLLASLKFREVQAQETKTTVDVSDGNSTPKTDFHFTDVPPGPDDNDLVKVLLNCEPTAEVEASDALVFNFKGRVVDSSGNAVEGATVLLVEDCFSTKLAQSEDLVLQIKDKPCAKLPSATAKTITASDGSFEFSNVKPPALKGNDPAMWQGAIVAAHKNLGVQWDRLNHSNYKIPNRQDMQLMPTTSLSGVFQTPDGQPLANAVVALRDLRTSNQDRFYDSLSVAFTELQPTTLTDAKGQFIFKGIPESTIVYLQCKHPAWAISGASFKTTQFKTPFQWDQSSPLLSSPGTIVADKEFTFRGRITGESGEPVQGMHVAISGATATTRSDANGDYAIVIPSALAKRSIGERGSMISVFPGKGSPYLETRVRFGVIGPHEEFCETAIEVQKGVRVSGKIVDENGEPAPGINVFAFDQYGKDSAHGFTDAHGTFGLYVSKGINQLVFSSGTVSYQLPSFSDVIKLTGQRANDTRGIVYPSSWTTVEADASSGEAVELDAIHVKKPTPIKIKVVASNGSAAVDARVELQDYVEAGDYFFPVSQSLATDANGELSILSYGLLSDRAVGVTSYRSSDGVLHYCKTPLSQLQDGQLVVDLAGQSVVRGRVLLNGMPIAGAKVDVMAAMRQLDSSNREILTGLQRITSIITDSDGTYAVALDSMDGYMVSVVSVPKYGEIRDNISIGVVRKGEREYLLPDLDVQVENEVIVKVSSRERQ